MRRAIPLPDGNPPMQLPPPPPEQPMPPVERRVTFNLDNGPEIRPLRRIQHLTSPFYSSDKESDTSLGDHTNDMDPNHPSVLSSNYLDYRMAMESSDTSNSEQHADRNTTTDYSDSDSLFSDLDSDSVPTNTNVTRSPIHFSHARRLPQRLHRPRRTEG